MLLLLEAFGKSPVFGKLIDILQNQLFLLGKQIFKHISDFFVE